MPSSAVSGAKLVASAGSVGVRSFNMFDMAGPHSDSGGAHGGWGLQVGVIQDNTEGFPSPPSIALRQPGVWRFRWQLSPGTQTISCYAKQPANASPYPSLIVKANSSIGVNADVTGTSPGGAGWVKIGPVTVVATAPGVVWVELRNNLTTLDPTRGVTGPWAICYFDNIDI
jgi:hypothetical protein